MDMSMLIRLPQSQKVASLMSFIPNIEMELQNHVNNILAQSQEHLQSLIVATVRFLPKNAVIRFKETLSPSMRSKKTGIR